jgi:hypothetical protein
VSEKKISPEYKQTNQQLNMIVISQMQKRICNIRNLNALRSYSTRHKKMELPPAPRENTKISGFGKFLFVS